MLKQDVRKLSINTIGVVAAVLQSRSMTSVGNGRGISQAAISQHVRRFEQAVGLAVVHKVGNRLVPTAHGDRIKQACLDAIKAMTLLDEYAQLGRLRARIGIHHHLFELVVGGAAQSKVLEEYLLVVSNGEQLLRRYAEGDIELVVRPLFPDEAAPQLAATVPFVWVGTQSACEAGKNARATHGIPVIMSSLDSACSLMARNYLESRNIAFHITANASDLAALRVMLASGLGFALVPQFVLPILQLPRADTVLPSDLRAPMDGVFGTFYHSDTFTFFQAEKLHKMLFHNFLDDDLGLRQDRLSESLADARDRDRSLGYSKRPHPA